MTDPNTEATGQATGQAPVTGEQQAVQGQQIETGAQGPASGTATGPASPGGDGAPGVEAETTGPDTGDDAVSAVEANLPDDDPRGNPAAADEDGATWGEEG